MKKEKKCNCDEGCKCHEGGECTCGGDCKCCEGSECTCGGKCKCHEGAGCACGTEHDDGGRIAELTNDLQRTRADFENYRKQIEAQKQAERKLARYATVSKMLPLLDDIDRAVGTYEELKPLIKSLTKTMQELGLKKIDMVAGAEFDPELAEAVMAEGDGEKEVIGEVLRPGYYYEGEVLRPAMVKVKKM
ncbi:nucleotide exchange factor GrpE [Candidatus Saccharibacteria bacterium]|nr:nucleotide exchange factor GrpE [Candidatus Saccharibacteria bacterium]